MARYNYRLDDSLDLETDAPQRPPRQRKKAPQQNMPVAEEDLSANFVMTYHPAQYEEVWLRESLRNLFAELYLADVAALVKGGKEASVYRCAPHPRIGTGWVAAKVYRPRMFRNLSNDAMYRQGRSVLTSDGKAAKKTDHRLMRAIGKKTAFGVEAAHTSWLMYEFTTLQKLQAAGAAVPSPIAVNNNVILMDYIGDEHRAAPTLHEIALSDDEAPDLFAEVLRNIEILMQTGYVHGDLSAYNILYWNGTITLIDFPQVADIEGNPHAFELLQRDITRVCSYFGRYGVEADPRQIAQSIWQRYLITEEIGPQELAKMLENDQ